MLGVIIRPEHKVINDLFGNDIKYIIPEYQRPYSWDCIGKSDRNNQVNVMWEDLISHFEKGNKSTYFLGAMVLIEEEPREFQVIDGQQRLTTLVLLFVAIKCFLKKAQLEGQNREELDQFIEDAIGEMDRITYNKKTFGVRAEKKVKIERNAGFNYDDVLQAVMNCQSIAAVNKRNVTEEQNTVIERFFSNEEFLEEKFRFHFLEGHIFTLKMAIKLNSFIEFLKNKVSIVRILTPTFEVAYQIFEILNNRGLPLSNKDLFRNFIIKEFDALKQSNLEKYQAP